jgi:hypothetical protein
MPIGVRSLGGISVGSMSRRNDLPRDDPRNPRRTLFPIILTMLVLGWFLWVLANWPDSVVFQ